MFDIGFWEIFLITVVALVVVGPERLPKLVRVTGLWIGRANSSIQSIRNEISQELRAEELKQALDKTINLDEITAIEPNTIDQKKTVEAKTLEKDNNDNG